MEQPLETEDKPRDLAVCGSPRNFAGVEVERLKCLNIAIVDYPPPQHLIRPATPQFQKP